MRPEFKYINVVRAVVQKDRNLRWLRLLSHAGFSVHCRSTTPRSMQLY